MCTWTKGHVRAVGRPGAEVSQTNQSHQKPTLLVPRSSIPSPQNCEKINVSLSVCGTCYGSPGRLTHYLSSLSLSFHIYQAVIQMPNSWGCSWMKPHSCLEPTCNTFPFELNCSFTTFLMFRARSLNCHSDLRVEEKGLVFVG